MGRLCRAVLAASILVVVVAAPAAATFRGGNGKIAHVYTSGGNDEIYTVNPDGSGRTNITNNPAQDGFPQWSPDGSEILFVSDRAGNPDIFVMGPNGSAQTPLTTDPAVDSRPLWSPDGTKIAFSSTRGGDIELWVMNADGSGETQLTDGIGIVLSADWSPDSTQLVFERAQFGTVPESYDIYTINADGSGLSALTAEPDHDNDSDPKWSPAGSKIAFENWPPSSGRGDEIWTMNPDGSGKRFVYWTQGGAVLRSWEPAGSRLLLWPITTMNSDGTNVRRWRPHDRPPQGDSYYSYAGEIWSPDARYLAGSRTVCILDYGCLQPQIFVLALATDTITEIAPGGYPDWQPVFPNTYPRPKSARPIQVTLVSAYEPCVAPNRVHGPPLAYDSCSPPRQTSAELTVGTPDANGKGANSTSGLLIDLIPGDISTPIDEADVRLRGQVKDVRLASDLSDYMGALETRISVRITDKDNTPSPDGPGAATVQDLTYSFPLSCTATAATTIGGECNVDTTADTLAPGTAKEGLRAVWQLGQVQVHDGAGDVFMRQGIFAP